MHGGKSKPAPSRAKASVSRRAIARPTAVPSLFFVGSDELIAKSEESVTSSHVAAPGGSADMSNPLVRAECELKVSIDAIGNDTREAPWYGPWNIVLRDFLFLGTHTAHAISITHPQYPVDRRVDTIDPDADIEVNTLAQMLLSLDMRRDEDRGSLGGDTSSVTESPVIVTESVAHLAKPPSFVSSAAPTQSIPILASSVDMSPHTPPRQPADPQKQEPTMSKCSTRIPDFAQVAHELACTGDFTNIPLQILRTRVDLLTEVKAPPPPRYRGSHLRTGRIFLNAQMQTRQQAQWAFADDETLTVIGVLLCVGAKWTYIEYTRTDLGPVATESERKDPTWVPPSGALSDGSDVSAAPSPPAATEYGDLTAGFLHDIFGGADWLELQDAEGRSKKAFSKIIERLQEQHEDLWGPIA
ncbi:hypothetical protein BV25DRAFT_1916820 [Artomyces pyxidatus]|uniref:Uncharacterized protein n=1 Tax=Artomyces pyxidatus TaxID=48021 RepID=A0ACB8SXY5_9AGAM|nr:hypothetical protein BV25DRAFT_1916820 [Artomyces pyxidatus]